MKKKSWIAVLVGIVLWGTSCSSLQTLSFDQLQAGDVSFPESVRRVGVVNNLPVVSPPNQPGIISKELVGDGQVAAEALAKQLANVNYFDEVVICDSALRASDVHPRTAEALTSDEVLHLTQALGVDMLFAVDRIHLLTRPSTVWIPELPIPLDAVEAAVSATVRVYVPKREKALFVVSKPDTLCWEIQPSLCDSLLVKEASEYAVSLPVAHLLPHWEEVTRYYYAGGGVAMRDAAVCLREHDWEGAARLWKETFECSKGKKRMQAAFNLALCAEVKDELQQAEDWIGKAKSLAKPGTVDARLIGLYETVLKERRSKVQQLHIQMKRFETNF